MPETVMAQRPSIDSARATVLDEMPVSEHRMNVAGVPTAVLVGGDGAPMVLLAGPGESSLWWTRVLPELTRRHRVIAPDYPGHGNSGMVEGLDGERIMKWLDALIERTCDAPPILVGHVVGGAMAARYAARHPERVASIVLVDALGLRRFLPRPAFGYRLFRFVSRPSRETYEPFLDQCMVDAGRLARNMERKWEPFVAYHLDGSQDADHKQAMGVVMKHFGVSRIPPSVLASIKVPTALIWGRHDKATPLHVAQKASQRFGWPLHIVEDSGDDPKLEQPDGFLEALDKVERGTGSGQAGGL